MSAGQLSPLPAQPSSRTVWSEPPSLPALDAALSLLQAPLHELQWEPLTLQYRQLAVSLAQQQRPASSWYALTLALAAATAVYAVPVGLGLAWMLLAVINVEAFGWRLPMRLSPDLIARLGLAALATALAAGALPALRLARITPAQLLRVFADER